MGNKYLFLLIFCITRYSPQTNPVVPAKVGTHNAPATETVLWVPTFAGMTAQLMRAPRWTLRRILNNRRNALRLLRPTKMKAMLFSTFPKNHQDQT